MAADRTLPAPGSAGSLGYNKAIVIDAVASVVDSVTSQNADRTYGAGEQIVVDVVFSEPVTVTGTPQIALNAGDPPVAYTGGSGTATLSFTYTVGATANSPDLGYVGTDALALNGGAIRDEVGNDAELTLPAPGADGSLSFDHDLVVLNGCDWDVSMLPSQDIHNNNYFGEIAFAADCDILATGAWETDDVYKVSRIDGSVTTFATLAGAGGLLGVVYRPADGTVYVGSDGPNQLWRIDAAGNGTLVMTLPEIVTSLAVAPSGFGSYGGMLFGAGHDGNVYVIDPAVPPPRRSERPPGSSAIWSSLPTAAPCTWPTTTARSSGWTATAGSPTS